MSNDILPSIPLNGRLVTETLLIVSQPGYAGQVTSPIPTVRPILSWRPSSVLGVIAIWTALGLLSAASAAFAFRQVGRAVDWGALLTSRLSDWYTCAMFTPVFIWLARRWPLEGRWWLIRVPAWVAVTSVAVPIKYVLYRAVVMAWIPSQPAEPLGRLIASSFVSESMAFWATIAVIYAVEHYDGLRQGEVQAAALKAELSEARLEALGAQLHPHFLFNTLQGISTLIHRDPASADRMLTRLSDLLRLTLAAGERPEVSLAEELEVLDRYIEIQRVRFQDRLVVDRAIPPALTTALVPRFILQPLVENAVRHGIGQRAGAGRIEVAAERKAGSLILTVTDDGHDPLNSTASPPSPEGRGGPGVRPNGGIGLSNTRRRLAALYGEAGRLTLRSLTGGGHRVELTLPYRAPEAG
jgi:signal transduction histidine kinase